MRTTLTCSAALALCLALAWPVPHARAAEKRIDSTIDLRVAVEGRETGLFIAADPTPTLLLDEVLTDGTRHARFRLGIGCGQWQLDDHVAWTFGEMLAGVPWALPRVDTYLSPQGASRLTFYWSFPGSCHGGCGITHELSFRLDSPTSSLFAWAGDAPTVPDLNTARFSWGQGHSLWSMRWLYGPEADRRVTHFTVVPEPDAGLLLAGAMLASVGAFRRGRASVRLTRAQRPRGGLAGSPLSAWSSASSAALAAASSASR